MEYKEFLELKAKIQKRENERKEIRNRIRVLSDHRPTIKELMDFLSWLIDTFNVL